MSVRKNLIIIIVLMAPFAIAGGELLWQTFLMDLLGMRDIVNCVNGVFERELKPQVEESLRARWEQHLRAEAEGAVGGIMLHVEELTSAMHVEFFTDERVDYLAERTIITTSCRELETAHWQVRTSIQAAIDDASWQAIGEILSQSESTP